MSASRAVALARSLVPVLRAHADRADRDAAFPRDSMTQDPR